MAPPLLQLDGIGLSFGSEPLLEDISLNVSAGEHIALVGRNGSGKSTLLKIVAGLVEPREGTLFRQPNATVRYLPQAPDTAGFDTVRDYVVAGLGPADDQNRADYLLDGLGLTGAENPAKLSGGEGRRAAIARVLAPQPDILLLDEPTNHLDLATIEWLEGELVRTPSAIVMISHDRRFLERVSKTTIWLDRGTVRRLDQGFGAFEAWRDKLLEEEERDQHKLGRQIVREEHWLRYGVTARRKRNMRRLGELQTMRERHRTRRGPEGASILKAAEATDSGKLVIEAKAISKSYGDRAIVRDFSIRIARGDRLGLVGPNGAGKTTLLKLLTGAFTPDDGTIRRGANIELASFDQHRDMPDPEETLAHYLTEGAGDQISVDGKPRHVASYMKDFLFKPEQARSPVRELSGGEKARLALARILARPSNLLVLDEPTNDLDMETLDLLQELVAGYPGTVILVSHDRDFLDRTVTSILVPEGDGRWTEYAGGYSDMLAQRGSHGIKGAIKSSSSKAAAPASQKAEKPRNTSAKLSYKQKYALETLPREIEAASAEIGKLEAKLADPDFYGKEPKAFADTAAKLDQLRDKRSGLEEEWLELEMLREEIEGG
ncbi:MAG: ABC-F family ATP-binding cassette domain-containing protein [Rhizobiaceae bacterium]|nr:ABC-F family ATP-binding cassette domain-containing protein [Rhizobiaceae bacterium]